MLELCIELCSYGTKSQLYVRFLVVYLLRWNFLKAINGFSKFAKFSSSHAPRGKRTSPYNRPYTEIYEQMLVWRLQPSGMWRQFLRKSVIDVSEVNMLHPPSRQKKILRMIPRYQTTRRHILQARNLHSHHYKSLVSVSHSSPVGSLISACSASTMESMFESIHMTAGC